MSTMTTMQSTWTIAPEGVSAITCRRCKKNATEAQENRLVTHPTYVAVNCNSCGVNLQFCSDRESVRSDSAMFLDPEAVFISSWFHSTARLTWIEDLNRSVFLDTPMVHLGTEKAALDRAYMLRRENSKKYERMFVHEIRLLPDFDIDATIARDLNEEWPETLGECIERGFSHGITRYLNVAESPGSISLLVPADAVEVVSTIAI